MSGPQASSSTPPASSPTFSHVLEVEPLARACVSVLAQEALTPRTCGSGLKVLRLVSKKCNEIMLRAVRKYTLNLDGEEIEEVLSSNNWQSTKLPHLLRHTQLSSLRVNVEGEWLEHLF